MFWPCVSSYWRTVYMFCLSCQLCLGLRGMVSCSKTHTLLSVSALTDGWWVQTCLWISWINDSTVCTTLCNDCRRDKLCWFACPISYSSSIDTTWNNMSSHFHPSFKVTARLFQSLVALLIAFSSRQWVNRFDLDLQWWQMMKYQ